MGMERASYGERWPGATAEQLALFGIRKLAEQHAASYELDLSLEGWTQLLAQSPVYAKLAVVRARRAIPGEFIRTVLADGTVETERFAGEAHMVISNPGGEEYLVEIEKFAARYAETELQGVYEPIGMVRALSNPTGAQITIMAPWGEKQYGAHDCLILASYSHTEPGVVGPDRYLIGAKEFADTYRPIA